MPLTLVQLRDKANARLTAIWPAIVAKQNAYFATHGKYFQKIITNQPQDEEELLWQDNAPNDEKFPADSVLVIDGGGLPFAIRIDEWVGETVGWSATVNVKLANGDVYTRTRDYLNNDTNWSLVPPPEVIVPTEPEPPAPPPPEDPNPVSPDDAINGL